MARKRGGIAGLWDRNKGIIKPIATIAAGALGTPALGAAVGAALGGFDRAGKSGIGFDVGQGVKGGVSGYAGGAVGNALGGAAGIGKLGAFQKAGSALGNGAKSLVGMGGGGASSAAGSIAPASTVAGAPVTQFPTSGLSPIGSVAKAGGSWTKDPKNLQTAVSGLATVGGIKDAGTQAALSRDGQALQGRQVALQERENQQEQDQLAARRRTIEQLIPILMQQMNGTGGTSPVTLNALLAGR